MEFNRINYLESVCLISWYWILLYELDLNSRIKINLYKYLTVKKLKTFFHQPKVFPLPHIHFFFAILIRVSGEV